MQPTPEMLAAAEEAYGSDILCSCRPAWAERDIPFKECHRCRTIRTFASLLSEREAKAEKRGAEKVVEAVERNVDMTIGNPSHSLAKRIRAAARQALSELK